MTSLLVILFVGVGGLLIYGLAAGSRRMRIEEAEIRTRRLEARNELSRLSADLAKLRARVDELNHNVGS